MINLILLPVVYLVSVVLSLVLICVAIKYDSGFDKVYSYNDDDRFMLRVIFWISAIPCANIFIALGVIATVFIPMLFDTLYKFIPDLRCDNIVKFFLINISGIKFKDKQ